MRWFKIACDNCEQQKPRFALNCGAFVVRKYHKGFNTNKDASK
jgi:hypothetical protein